MLQKPAALMRKVLPRVAWGMAEAVGIVFQLCFAFFTVITMFIWFFVSLALGHVFVVEVLSMDPSILRTVVGAVSAGLIWIVGLIVLEIVEFLVILLIVAVLAVLAYGVYEACMIVGRFIARRSSTPS